MRLCKLLLIGLVMGGWLGVGRGKQWPETRFVRGVIVFVMPR